MTNSNNYYGVNNDGSSSSSSSSAMAAEESYNEEHSKNVSIYFLLFAALLSTVLILSKKLHSSPRLNAIISEAALTLLVGMFFSYCIMFYFLIQVRESDGTESDGQEGYDGTEEEMSPRHKSAYLLLQLVSFEPNVFFLGLLPPILFNAGYELQRELFYRHITPITLFAVLGTCLSAIATAFFLFLIVELGMMGSFQPTLMELLTFGSLIAATDTVSTLGVFQAKRVDPHIFYLVFGESALNDAVALVLYHSFADCLTTPPEEANTMIHEVGEFFVSFTYEAIGSPILGIFSAFVSARIFKLVDLREQKVSELSLYLLLMYTPFIIAENLHLSGIVTIFFTGMSARRYCAPNVSPETQKNSKAIFRLTSFLAETCIFLELGLSLSGLSGGFHWGFILWAFVATLVGRALAIYPISIYYNWSLGESVCVSAQNCNADMVIVDIDAITKALYKNTTTEVVGASDDSDSLPDDMTVESCSSSSANASSPWSIQRHTPEKRKDKEIPINFMHVLWFSGLRGAVAYACASRFPDVNGNRDEFLGATAVIVVFSIIVMGGAMGPLLQFLGIRTGVSEEEYMEKWHKERALKGPFHRFENKFIYRSAVRCESKGHKLGDRHVEGHDSSLEHNPSSITPSASVELTLSKLHHYDSSTEHRHTRLLELDYQAEEDAFLEDIPQQHPRSAVSEEQSSVPSSPLDISQNGHAPEEARPTIPNVSLIGGQHEGYCPPETACG